MLMLMIRPAGKLADGSARRVPIVRKRERKYGPVLEERVLSIKKDVLVSGPNSSGKTRWLAKLDDKAGEVWTGREKLFLRAMEPLQRWCEEPRVEAFAVNQGKTWAKLRSYERLDMLLAWAKASRPGAVTPSSFVTKICIRPAQFFPGAGAPESSVRR